jgi:hypothetical protein
VASNLSAFVAAFSRIADLFEWVWLVRSVQPQREDEDMQRGRIDPNPTGMLGNKRPTERVGTLRDFIPIETVRRGTDAEPITIADAHEISFASAAQARARA